MNEIKKSMVARPRISLPSSRPLEYSQLVVILSLKAMSSNLKKENRKSLLPGLSGTSTRGYHFLEGSGNSKTVDKPMVGVGCLQ